MTKFQQNHSRPGMIDAMSQYWAAARRLRNIALRSEAFWEKMYFIVYLNWYVPIFKYVFGLTHLCAAEGKHLAVTETLNY